MSRRASILGRLRRWNRGAARYVVAAFALAYLSAGVAPCASANVRSHAMAAQHEHTEPAHARHAEHVHEAHDRHGTADGEHAPDQNHADRHCPHCPAGAVMASEDHAACFVLEDLTNVAAAHAKDVPPSLAPSLVPAPFTLPPPLASPAPPLRAAAAPLVPLNVRHCVLLI